MRIVRRGIFSVSFALIFSPLKSRFLLEVLLRIEVAIFDSGHHWQSVYVVTHIPLGKTHYFNEMSPDLNIY